MYVCAVALGKIQSRRGEQTTPNMGSIEADGVDIKAGTGDD